jgi:DNA transposition AAA+ family ATPase
MTDKDAKNIALLLGNLPDTTAAVQEAIERLNRNGYLQLHHVQIAHDWLEGKRKSHQSGRVVGESQTGKTMTCDAYVVKNKPQQVAGKPPTAPVIYIQVPEECGAKEFFGVILRYFNYQVVKETVAELRDCTLQVLKECHVEMLIIDEADRFKPKTFAAVRDISDNLQISVILVGTDRFDMVIKRDQQVYNRFRDCYRFEKLSGEDFVQTVKIWEQQVLQLPTPSNLTSKTMIEILGEATGGYIGLMDKILREAAIRSIAKGLEKIDVETLKAVAMQYR